MNSLLSIKDCKKLSDIFNKKQIKIIKNNSSLLNKVDQSDYEIILSNNILFIIIFFLNFNIHESNN